MKTSFPMGVHAAFCGVLMVVLPGSLVGAERTLPKLMEASRTLEGTTFGEVVEAATGQRVLAVDREADAEWIAVLGREMDAVLEALNDPGHPIHKAGRVNEASRYIEDVLAERLDALEGWECSFPQTSLGTQQRAGYPDLRVVLPDGSICYVDPKLYAKPSRRSSFRTFYYEPKVDTNKINDDARHVLIGVAHEAGPEGRFRFASWELVDVSSMPVRLKLEFQASNRDIYREEATLATSEEE